MAVFSTLRRCLEELSDFILHAFQLVEAQLRVGHDKDIARDALFVDQDTPVWTVLGLHLFQHAFALEHRGENVTRVCERIVRCN